MLALCAEYVDPNARTSSGITAAHVAASRGDVIGLLALKAAGADISVLSADRVRLRQLEQQTSALELRAATRTRVPS